MRSAASSFLSLFRGARPSRSGRDGAERVYSPVGSARGASGGARSANGGVKEKVQRGGDRTNGGSLAVLVLDVMRARCVVEVGAARTRPSADR